MPRPRTYVCPACKLAPKEISSGYCRACHRIKDRAWKRTAAALPPEARIQRKLSYRAGGRAIPKLGPNACNCGNPACNGLTCESIRHGTAA